MNLNKIGIIIKNLSKNCIEMDLTITSVKENSMSIQALFKLMEIIAY